MTAAGRRRGTFAPRPLSLKRSTNPLLLDDAKKKPRPPMFRRPRQERACCGRGAGFRR
ncbi:hypothetical protein BN1263520085 [Stenotrophomonas indicatrix]|nr:hypothetical protein BN1263520085 [Stenotrophomonas indicatrix]